MPPSTATRRSVFFSFSISGPIKSGFVAKLTEFINFGTLRYVTEFPTVDHGIRDGPRRVSQTSMDLMPAVGSVACVHFRLKGACSSASELF